MKAKSIDHICFAVRNLDEAVARYRDVLGLEPDGVYTAESEKIRVARYYLGEVAVELMEPTDPDSDVGRFLEKRGEGFFLISYRVDDVEEGLRELESKGYPLIDRKPRELMGNRYAFILPPARMNGTLVEILDGEFEGYPER
ncbi:VOC family protein [Deferrisoma camini]|uniref:VOC family protein n=1 Tax=Deferrisoma camini TaxID=1035120 RepID=UPI00046D6EBA|nr:VOC family protein [Deferrisoma camini]NOY45991.1 VOC family protein [Deltaproteobacteria bacterium]